MNGCGRDIAPGEWYMDLGQEEPILKQAHAYIFYCGYYFRGWFCEECCKRAGYLW